MHLLTLLLATLSALPPALSLGRNAPYGATISGGVDVLPSCSSPADNHPRQDSWGNARECHRRVVSIRASTSATDDISADLLWALQEANEGGMVWLKPGETYVIGKKLDLTFLKDVYFRLDGELKFTDDVAYWQANYFYHPFQKSISFWQWGGTDIRIYGTGTLNGNGQAWYDGFNGHEILDPTNTYYRPILFYAINITRLSVSGLHYLNSPCWNNFIVSGSDISFSRIRFDSFSTSSARPKNTDGFDTYNVDKISVTDCEVNIGDDCFSPKPNTTNIYVKNLWCNGTHGVSMGSIGQYPGVMDIIENAWIENVTMLEAQNGARLKAWAGPGVGYGRIHNITFKDFYNHNVDAPIVLDQCYFNVNASTCLAYPSRVNISHIRFQNITGWSSGKNGRTVASLVCSTSPDVVCEDVNLSSIDLHSPKGEPPIVVCEGVKGDIGVPCVPRSMAAKMRRWVGL